MTRTEQAIERLDNLVQQNGALVQQNSNLTGILEVCDMNAEERALGKKKIVQAIIKMGGSASEDDSLFALAAAIKKLKTLDPRTVVTDDLPRPVNVGTYICQSELLQNKIVHAYSEEVTNITNATFGNGEQTLQSVDFPNATTCSARSALMNNPSLKSINLPKLKVITSSTLQGLSLDYINIPSVTTIANSSFYNMNYIDTLYLPNATTFSGYNSFFNKAKIDKLLLPNLINIANGAYDSFTACTMRVLDISSWNTIFNTQNKNLNGCTKLIDLIIGKNIKFSLDLWGTGYNPTEAYSKTSASLVDKGEPFSTNNQKWNYNLREHFAANLDDRTGLDAFTITFGSTVLAQMEEATIEAFTSKNWTLA